MNKRMSMYLEQHKTIRVLGIDDTPFQRQQQVPVAVAGIVCANTRMEGMLWTHVQYDGDEASDTLIQWIAQSKFYDGLHAVLIDGIALAGFNVIDLPRLAQNLGIPCFTVMRKPPDMPGMLKALANLGPDFEQPRRALLAAAGPIYQHGPFYYQVQGLEAKLAGHLLERVTDTGHVPEALRLAHLIGAAVLTGQSSKRA